MINALKLSTIVHPGFLFCLFMAVTALYADHWPQFRGPHATGIGKKTLALPAVVNEKQNLLWKSALCSGHSSPCIWEDRIFLTEFAKDTKQFYVTCLTRQDGKILWRQDIPVTRVEKTHSVGNPAASTPVTDGTYVYFYFGSYGLLCYDFSGNQIWAQRRPIPDTGYGYVASPILFKDQVIFCNDERKDPSLIAFNKTDGALLWKTALSKPRQTSYATPVLWGDEVVLHRMGHVLGFSAQDGQRIWQISAATKGTSTPVVGNNVLFVGAWTNFGETEQRKTLPTFRAMLQKYDQNNDGFIRKSEIPDTLLTASRPEVIGIPKSQTTVKFWFDFVIDRNKDKLVNEKEWLDFVAFIKTRYQDHGLIAVKPGGKGDITHTHILWREQKKVPEVPSPLYYQERVYMVKNGGLITCMHAQDGTILFRERLGAAGPYYASPVAADDKIFIASGKGVVTVLDASDPLEILSKNDLNEKIFATPALAGNTIYIRTAKHLYAFGS